MQNSKDLIEILIYIIVLIIIVFAAFSVFIFKSRDKIYQKEIEKKNLELNIQNELVQNTLITQEKERERIAQDLHDAISSKLNVITLQSNMLLLGKIPENDFINTIENIRDIATETLESSREIAHNLLPPVFEKFGLHEAINELAIQFSNKGLQVCYDNSTGENTYKNIPNENKIHLFRILQELITNSIKHGKANKIEIDTKENALFYSDNGTGISTQKTKLSKGLGTQNIKNRIKILNATFTINNKPTGTMGIIVKIQF